ncbi:MAG: hypothetical protein NZ942_00310 [Candidatus Aenigmarchaeota archaeon]|nr:hypothetical protein [Candidatus Aenigmarchaeota archaeon]
MEKLEKIFKKSIEVFKECSLRNGAIVASNIYDPDYPKGVKNYFYVWPRDASFVCYACDLLKIKKIPEKFFEWCWEAENFKEESIFYMRYYPSGKMYGKQFQPDQLGSVIWAIYNHSEIFSTNEFNDLAKKIAEGICSCWKGDCFKRHYDLWEERVASPKKHENFTYSLAMCIKGLDCALKLIGPNKRWEECLNQMRTRIEKAYDEKIKSFVRKFNSENDKTVDSSLLGLVWPSGVFNAKDVRIVTTVEKIIKENSTEGKGIMRYKGDNYAGYLRRKEGGAWPVLNFWLSIYFCLAGNKTKALEYFNWVLEKVDEKLPEQIKNGKPASVIPLAWSHAMFIISGKFLGFF